MTPTTLKATAEHVKAQAIDLAWASEGDANIDAAASHLIQAFHFLNRAANK